MLQVFVLKKNLKSKIKLDYLYDETLIGGLVMKVGSTMVDTSIKTKLKKNSTILSTLLDRIFTRFKGDNNGN